MNGSITATTAPGQSGPESNGNESLFHIPQMPGLDAHHQINFNVIPRIFKDLFSHCD